MIMDHNITTCIFDLDGTLIDSMWIWESIDREYLGRYGLECPEGLEKIVEGMTFTETAKYFKKRFLLKDTVEKIKADWEEMSIDKYVNEVPLKTGVREFLDLIKRRGIRTGIATSNGRNIVDAVLKALDIKDLFDNILTGCEVGQGKPHPEIYLKSAYMLGAKAKNCLVFEDIPAGIIAGKAAGMKVYAVEDDFSMNRKEEKIRLSDRYIINYTEMLP